MLGESEGTKDLVQVLLLHRHLQHRDVVAGPRAGLAVGARTADGVALEARKAAEAEGRSPNDQVWVDTVMDASGYTWRATYDEAGRMLTEVPVVVDRAIVDGYVYPAYVDDNGYLIVEMDD